MKRLSNRTRERSVAALRRDAQGARRDAGLAEGSAAARARSRLEAAQRKRAGMLVSPIRPSVCVEV